MAHRYASVGHPMESAVAILPTALDDIVTIAPPTAAVTTTAPLADNADPVDIPHSSTFLGCGGRYHRG